MLSKLAFLSQTNFIRKSQWTLQSTKKLMVFLLMGIQVGTSGELNAAVDLHSVP